MEIKAYILEDNETMRFLLTRMLTKYFSEIRVAGQSETAEQAFEEIPVLKPDLLLIDISLPGMDGLELIRRLRPLYRAGCTLVVTGHEIELYRQEAFEAGADDIISKADAPGLIKAIQKFVDMGTRH